jgi:transposase
MHIKHETGIEYSRNRISELMKEWGFKIKRPRMKSILADEEERLKFVKDKVPEVMKKAIEEAKRRNLKLQIMFTDEAGFRRDGTIHMGYYKEGKVPEIPESNGRFESIKTIGAVDPLEGKFNLKTVQGKITSEVYGSFLHDLSRKSKDKYLLIFHDNAPWHGKKKLPRILKELNVDNIIVCNLPKYSPDMNPCEKFWKLLRENVTHCQYYEDLKCLMYSIWCFYRRAYQNRELVKIRLKPETDIFSNCKSLQIRE